MPHGHMIEKNQVLVQPAHVADSLACYQVANTRIPIVIQEHAAICTAIASGRPTAARKAAATHLNESRKNLERLLFMVRGSE